MALFCSGQEKNWQRLKLIPGKGLHFTYISSVERGERTISLCNMAKIANALECSLKDLMPPL